MSTRAVELTDAEVAVTIDALAMTRDQLRNAGRATPNLDSALSKINGLITPATHGLRLEALDA